MRAYMSMRESPNVLKASTCSFRLCLQQEPAHSTPTFSETLEALKLVPGPRTVQKF